ncbi:unnamed protein product [Soboliphyme baturini]|uniref:Rho-GAP domain-containing protein n=1 Tax=Soboliphyme baturini TaxID=241478 RepID=A0A183IM20_9BILA|nr:unnamed protein product [Soboliphyme baturini]
MLLAYASADCLDDFKRLRTQICAKDSASSCLNIQESVCWNDSSSLRRNKRDWPRSMLRRCTSADSRLFRENSRTKRSKFSNWLTNFVLKRIKAYCSDRWDSDQLMERETSKLPFSGSEPVIAGRLDARPPIDQQAKAASNEELRAVQLDLRDLRAPSQVHQQLLARYSSDLKKGTLSTSPGVPIDALTLPQMTLLKKFCAYKLAGIMEKYSQPVRHFGWDFWIQRLIGRMSCQNQKTYDGKLLPFWNALSLWTWTYDFSERAIFDVPLSVLVQRTGQPIPQCILQSMEYLKSEACDVVGIFRKSGTCSRVQKLRQLCESATGTQITT